ncbi:EamA family transporter [Shinella granuli]|uniref:Putative blue pigment (Indigoidine) exporter n=1 Tax=Shinella granuli TaxID=323621 RepID=A0A4V2RHE3_SHIGR|nr:EamA family transporter [Shinella granuli]TCN40040.1 putative blue pigment (indigoidine) exporter [Shinella granuli]
MKQNLSDLSLTALAPIVWGSTYIVSTEFLVGFSPMTVAMLRALPAGVFLLAIVRQLPADVWWLRSFILGALNISIFLSMLFVAAYRLPGGVAGTVLSAQPLIVVFLASFLLSSRLRALAVLGALAGMIGVALLVLTPDAALDPIGIAAGLAGATSMAMGVTLARKWQPPVSPLTFTAWQLTAGGLLLVPVVVLIDGSIPVPTLSNLMGLVWLGLIGAALTYVLWFRGIGRLAPSAVSSLLFLSPLTAMLLRWGFLGQSLTVLQITGASLVIGSIWLIQRSS